MTLELCIPTLCCTAPEMPRARYSFGDTVLPVWPICASAGTSRRTRPPGWRRRRHRAPPPAPRPGRSSRPRPVPCHRPRSRRRPRPKDRPRFLNSPAADRGRHRIRLEGRRSPPRSPAHLRPPAPVRMTRAGTGPPASPRASPRRRAPSPGRPAACRSRSPPLTTRSTRSQLSPASRRAARPAATSAPRTEFESRKVS